MRLRVSDLTWQELDGEIIVLDLRGSAYYQLNGPGALLWQRLIEGCSREDLEAVLIERYDIDVEQAAADVDGFVADLLARRLLDADSR
jgi:hypothetical protein